MNCSLRTAAFAFFIGVLVGCASSKPVTARYDATTDQMLYEARDIRAGSMFENYGINSSTNVDVRAWARCHEQGCTPNKVWLGFVADNPRADIQIMNTNVMMRTESGQYTWSNRGSRTPEQNVMKSRGSREGLQTRGTYVRGMFVRVALTLQEFEEIATAKRVSGSIGQETFTLSYESRAPLRKLLERIRS